MSQSTKPWYIDFPLYLVRYILRGILWSALGFVVALPFAFVWLFAARAFAEVFPTVASFIIVGFLASAFGFVFSLVLANISDSGTSQETIRGSLLLALITAALGLLILYAGATSLKILVEFIGFKITVGTAIGIGAGIILSIIWTLLARPNKNKDRNITNTGCGIILFTLLCGYFGYLITDTIAQVGIENLRSVLDDLPRAILSVAGGAGLSWGFSRGGKAQKNTVA